MVHFMATFLGLEMRYLSRVYYKKISFRRLTMTSLAVAGRQAYENHFFCMGGVGGGRRAGSTRATSCNQRSRGAIFRWQARPPRLILGGASGRISKVGKYGVSHLRNARTPAEHFAYLFALGLLHFTQIAHVVGFSLRLRGRFTL